jgi:FixJ family two-component response regulator
MNFPPPGIALHAREPRCAELVAAGAAEAAALVYLIEADRAAREALTALLEAAGHEVHAFSCGNAFLSRPRADRPSCLILNGGRGTPYDLDIQCQLRRTLAPPTLLFLMERDDPVVSAVMAIKAGAFDVLTKPCTPAELLGVVDAALALNRARRQTQQPVTLLLDRYNTLTPRQRQVISLVCAGRMNKQMACALGLSEISVKIHRANVMKKMGARTLPDLVRAVDLLQRSNVV